MVFLIETTGSSASILQSKTTSALFNLQHYFLCRVTLLVTQLVKALRYKSEGRVFDSR
jgi:hypothetical protein